MGDKFTSHKDGILGSLRTHRQLLQKALLLIEPEEGFVMENFISFLNLISLPFPSRSRCLNPAKVKPVTKLLN